MRRRDCLGFTLRAAGLAGMPPWAHRAAWAVAATPAGAAVPLGNATPTAETGVASGPATASPYPPVRPGVPLRFPRDFGAHPAYRTEWWYLTGWLRAGERDVGVQVTFFRSRTPHDAANPSRFAPTQLVFAHAALAVDGERRLRHAQRAARAGFGLAGASEDDTDVAIGGWRLRRTPDDRYLASIDAEDFALALGFAPAAPPFAQGDAGFSRKGPRPEQASRYYSRPQLAVSGRVRLAPSGPRAAGSASRRGASADATARRDAADATDAATPPAGWTKVDAGSVAWLDHEWSSEILDADSSGWDWVGLNLDDGSALMAFRIRRRDGGVLWSHARWAGSPAPAPEPRFEPLRQWRSARSGARYPVSMLVTVGARRLRLEPMFDDQELDTRGSTGTVYWEGAVRVYEGAAQVGRGYLELTGYAGALRL